MSRWRGPRIALLLPLWAAASSLVGAVTGLVVGLFKPGGVETPIVLISVLFGNVVGLTAMVGSVVLSPRLRGLSPVVRGLLLGLGLLSVSALGSLAVLRLFPLFVFREPRSALAVVVINGVLALIVGAVVHVYETMSQRLQDSLREVEEVRLVQSRLREEAARAELAALQARIHPHFFFNTLNTIASLLDQDPERAELVLENLADVFRYAFKVADAGPVPLEEELAFTRGFLTIEQARFGDRLHVRWELDPEAGRVPVPGLILQPLVENAVTHGISPRAQGGTLVIRAALAPGRLLLEVADDGAGLGTDGERLIREGHGLGHVRQRLEVYFHGRARLELRNNPDGRGTLARLDLPAPSGSAAAGTPPARRLESEVGS